MRTLVSISFTLILLLVGIKATCQIKSPTSSNYEADRQKVVSFHKLAQSNPELSSALEKINKDLIFEQIDLIKKYSNPTTYPLTEDEKIQYSTLREKAIKKILKECDQSGFSSAFGKEMPKLMQNFDFASNTFLLNEEAKIMAEYGFDKEWIQTRLSLIEKEKAQLLDPNSKHAGNMSTWSQPARAPNQGCCFWRVEKDNTSGGWSEILDCTRCRDEGEGIIANLAILLAGGPLSYLGELSLGIFWNIWI